MLELCLLHQLHYKRFPVGLRAVAASPENLQQPCRADPSRCFPHFIIGFSLPPQQITMPSDAESFLGITPQPSNTTSAPDGIGLGVRFFVLSISWFTALFVALPDLRAISLIYAFPLGLPLLGHPPGKPEGNGFVLGWLLYGALSAAILLSTKRLWFFIFYTVLITFLIFNVAGCRQMLGNLKN